MGVVNNTAYEIPTLRFSGVVGMYIQRYNAVTMATDGRVKPAGTGDHVIGVSANGGEVGDELSIYNGIVRFQVAEAIKCNDYVTNDNNAVGKVGTKENAIGIALTSANGAGELISLKLF